MFRSLVSGLKLWPARGLEALSSPDLEIADKLLRNKLITSFVSANQRESEICNGVYNESRIRILEKFPTDADCAQTPYHSEVSCYVLYA